MARLNLTLADDTIARLAARAKRAHRPVAALARDILEKALGELDAEEWRRKVAADYAASHDDARELLADFDGLQVELPE
jgi:plasmid stability protein